MKIKLQHKRMEPFDWFLNVFITMMVVGAGVFFILPLPILIFDGLLLAALWAWSITSYVKVNRGARRTPR